MSEYAKVGHPKLIELNPDEIRARRYAAMFTDHLRDFIPAACIEHAQNQLARSFMELGIQISTTETRALKRITGSDHI